MIFPEPVISIAIEPKTKVDVEKLGVGLQKLAARRPVVPHLHRTKRRGRRSSPAWASSTSRSSSTASSASSRSSRTSASPRSRTARRSRKKVDVRVQVRQAVRRSRPVRSRAASRSSPGERGTGFVFENDIVGGVIPKEFIPVDRKGRPRGDEPRRARRLPARRREGAASTTAATTRSTRSRPGVRDRGVARLPGRREARRAPPARADHERSRSSSPSSTWATSSATSTRAAAASSA